MNEEIHLGFAEALGRMVDGRRVTRVEWEDKRHYGLVKDDLLQLHKAGEAEEDFHPWILSKEDLIAWDWMEVV